MRAVRGLIGLLTASILLVAVWFFYTVFGDRSHPASSVQVVIPRGSTFRGVADQLAASGVISNPAVFRMYAKLRHADTDIHAGGYRFAPNQTEDAVLAQLQSGGAQIATWVSIPEGFTARQIAQRLEDDKLGSADAYRQAFLHDTIVAGGTRTKNLEGYLFPSTYLVPNDATPAAVERILTGQFLKELPPDAQRLAKERGLTVPQVITLASLIEREAKADDERPLMAGVYYNRLKLGMPLEVDATIEYALPSHHDVITYGDLKIDSPYNSYLHQGLPPTPIANPGLPSILAAFHPRPSAFLYYVYKGNGHHVFAKTLAEQTANVAKYLK